jgi:hypothetical protein
LRNFKWIATYYLDFKIAHCCPIAKKSFLPLFFFGGGCILWLGFAQQKDELKGYSNEHWFRSATDGGHICNQQQTLDWSNFCPVAVSTEHENHCSCKQTLTVSRNLIRFLGTVLITFSTNVVSRWEEDRPQPQDELAKKASLRVLENKGQQQGD